MLKVNKQTFITQHVGTARGKNRTLLKILIITKLSIKILKKTIKTYTKVSKKTFQNYLNFSRLFWPMKIKIVIPIIYFKNCSTLSIKSWWYDNKEPSINYVTTILGVLPPLVTI